MNLKKIFGKVETRDKGLLTVREIDHLINNQIHKANKELVAGFNLIKKYPRSVSILGSARFKPDNKYYQMAESLGARIAKELNYTVVTGGGPGIMEAANKGAFEAGGKSIGFSIILPHEQDVNKYLTEYVEFDYFFTRKTLLFFSAETYIYFPGGFGTMDELFEIVTLIQTGEIPKVPVILVGREYWTPLTKFISEELYNNVHTIDEKDQNIYKIVDSEDEIIEIIKTAPFRQD